jgi:regulatory protein YycI of two-component signal transduction system YycFG
MDWSRIKTTLILALILTNVILGTFVWVGLDRNKQSEKHELDSILTILKSQNISIDTAEVAIPEEMPVLEATYQLYDLEAIAEILYLDDYYEVNGSYVDSRSKLEVFNKNTLIYQVLDAIIAEEIAPEEALEIAEAFLDHIGFNSTEKVLDAINTEDDETVVTFAHTIDGQFVNGSFMSLRIKGKEVVFFERQWLSVEKVTSRSVKLIPLSKAFYSLVGEVNKVRTDQRTPIEISSFELGYVMDQKIFDTKIQSGEAFPYYRFITSSGLKIYVEAIDKGR